MKRVAFAVAFVAVTCVLLLLDLRGDEAPLYAMGIAILGITLGHHLWRQGEARREGAAIGRSEYLAVLQIVFLLSLAIFSRSLPGLVRALLAAAVIAVAFVVLLGKGDKPTHHRA